MSAPVSIGTVAERAWQRFRAAIIARWSNPGPRADAKVRRLREALIAALEGGER